MREEGKDEGARLFATVPTLRRPRAQMEIQPEHEEMLFYGEGGPGLAGAESPSLEILGTRLDAVLGSLLWLALPEQRVGASPSHSGVW